MSVTTIPAAIGSESECAVLSGQGRDMVVATLRRLCGFVRNRAEALVVDYERPGHVVVAYLAAHGGGATQ